MDTDLGGGEIIIDPTMLSNTKFTILGNSLWSMGKALVNESTTKTTLKVLVSYNVIPI